tara:strand:- start:1185 stop:2456 length:1272 start_codon:yes stop_codon:yes gene_type:complete
MNPQFSVVIPTLNNFSDVKEIVKSVNAQTLLPSEIILADSSSADEIETEASKLKSFIPIIYIRVGRAYKFDRFLHRVFSLPFFSIFKKKFPRGRAFPYEATNAGSKIAQFEWLAFLDATTIPKKTWLEDYWRFIENNQCDVVFGKTKYFADTKFQKLLRASTYGRLGHETAPGSIMKKVTFLDGNQITEGVRSGGDVVWKIRIKDSMKYFLPEKIYLSYSNLPLGLFATLKKFFIYQLYGSLLDIQHNIKDLYFGLALMLSIIIVPKWNYIVGWDSPFFIPHITKIFFISILIIALIIFIINRGILRSYSNNTFRVNLAKFFTLVLVSYSVFNWNAAVAKWVEDSIWYIPHITKIFIALLFFASFFYRGIYFPIKNNISAKYLFPFKWIEVGLLGILLDLVKAPGYLLGSILASMVKRSKIKN